jgi:teichuronic acid biosynthesis glycosyltransferase TuaH
MHFNSDIIIIGQQPWDTEIGSNCKNIALELSKTNRVLYVNSPLDRISLMRGRKDPKVQKRLNVIRKTEVGLVKLKDNLWNLYPDCIVESINWLNNHKLFDYLNKLNNKKLASSIGKALHELNFKTLILFNDNEMFKGFYLSDFLKPELSIYYSRDYMLGVDYWKKHGERIEPLLIEKSNLCFANSTYLADYCKQYNTESYYVGQGCDVEEFAGIEKLEKPEDLFFDKPVIGYVGSLNSIRLDMDIIAYIAEHCPDFQLVLVGPEDELFKVSKLHFIPNISFLGQKKVEELPQYINGFDICINPQLINEVTIGNYPRKIDEYLAAGKPTVVSHTKTMEVFEDYVYLANSKEDYVTLIKKAFEENNTNLAIKRRDFALTHTWENSVAEIRKEMSRALNSRID